VKKALLILSIILLSISFSVFSQEPEAKDTLYVTAENDSLLYVELDAIDVYPERGRKMNYRRYSRLVRKLRKVYPFAREAVIELKKYSEMYENADNERDKRKYVRKVEKELFRRHEDELKKLTISEGRYLILLIDRETGNTSYSIIKEVKGGLPAFFWQGIARIFSNDLKEEYDPHYKHFVIEQIVLMLEKEYDEEEEKAKDVSSDNRSIDFRN